MFALPDGVEARDAIRPAHRAPLQVLVQDLLMVGKLVAGVATRCRTEPVICTPLGAWSGCRPRADLAFGPRLVRVRLGCLDAWSCPWRELRVRHGWGVPWCQVVSSDRETGFACWRSGGEDCGRHPDVARMRDGYAAFAKGDFAVLNDLFAEDLFWREPGRSQLIDWPVTTAGGRPSTGSSAR